MTCGLWHCYRASVGIPYDGHGGRRGNCLWLEDYRLSTVKAEVSGACGYDYQAHGLRSRKVLDPLRPQNLCRPDVSCCWGPGCRAYCKYCQVYKIKYEDIA
jgi:hypothetical protein